RTGPRTCRPPVRSSTPSKRPVAVEVARTGPGERSTGRAPREGVPAAHGQSRQESPRRGGRGACPVTRLVRADPLWGGRSAPGGHAGRGRAEYWHARLVRAYRLPTASRGRRARAAGGVARARLCAWRGHSRRGAAGPARKAGTAGEAVRTLSPPPLSARPRLAAGGSEDSRTGADQRCPPIPVGPATHRPNRRTGPTGAPTHRPTDPTDPPTQPTQPTHRPTADPPAHRPTGPLPTHRPTAGRPADR